MQIVKRSNLAEVLAELEPSGGSGRAAIGLAAVMLLLWDLLSLADFGRGPTGLILSRMLGAAIGSTGLFWLESSPITTVSWIAVVLDSALLWIGISLLRNSRWLALYRRRMWETVTHLPRLADVGSSPAIVAVLGASIAGAAYVAAKLMGGLTNLTGSMPIALLLAIFLGLGVGALVVGVAVTARIDRFPAGGGLGLASLALLVIGLTSPPLAEVFGGASKTTEATRLVNWVILAFAAVVLFLLFLAFETDQDSLHLELRWDSDTDSAAGLMFEHVAMPQMSSRRAILHVNPQGRPILLVTQTVGEPYCRVTKPSGLDTRQSIDLNQTGCTIWDLHEVSASLLDTGDKTAPIVLSDSQGLLQIEVAPYARPSSAALPENMRISKQTFDYLKDHIFLPGAFALQMPSAVTTAFASTLSEITNGTSASGQAGLSGDRLAKMAADWDADYYALDLVHTADGLKDINVLFRIPSFVDTLKDKERLADVIIKRIDDDVEQLYVLENRLKSVTTEMSPRVQVSLFTSFEELIGTPDTEQRKAVRDVLGLFNVTATAKLNKLDGIEKLREKAKSTQTKLATDKNEARIRVEALQKEVYDTFFDLLKLTTMNPLQRKFLEVWLPVITGAPPRPITPSSNRGNLPRPPHPSF